MNLRGIIFTRECVGRNSYAIFAETVAKNSGQCVRIYKKKS